MPGVCGGEVPRIRRQPEKHGLSKTREYWIWHGMIARCYNPKANDYHRYGGRGIAVCDRWRYSFTAFIRDMGRRPSRGHSIDRINNDGNYEPENCRWATAIEQRANASPPHYPPRKRGPNRKPYPSLYVVTHDGVTDTLANWARMLGINPQALRRHVRFPDPVARWLYLQECRRHHLPIPRGPRDPEKNGNARLTHADVAEIRILRGKVRQIDLAARFGVRQAVISRIQNGRSWHAAP